MIRLYHGSGAQSIELLPGEMPAEEWIRKKKITCDMLRSRGHDSAATLLESLPFTIREATNDFGDDFSILYWSAPLAEYEKAAEWVREETHLDEFPTIASAVSEATKVYIRFIAVELNTDDNPGAVQAPALQITSDVVERALRDAASLMGTSGATSGVDRVHTALHGYLKDVCDRAGIAYPHDPSVTQLYKLLRTQHPDLTKSAAQDASADRILKSFSSMIDALNTVRNQGTLAHPNPILLLEAEAMVFINATRTMLHYLDAKIR